MSLMDKIERAIERAAARGVSVVVWSYYADRVVSHYQMAGYYHLIAYASIRVGLDRYRVAQKVWDLRDLNAMHFPEVAIDNDINQMVEGVLTRSQPMVEARLGGAPRYTVPS